ncbi:hypothetical protein ACQWFT_24890, partial [Salmonella enterica subsp. enterica serovar Infantis]
RVAVWRYRQGFRAGAIIDLARRRTSPYVMNAGWFILPTLRMIPVGRISCVSSTIRHFYRADVSA